ncbi:hypothetical protein [Caniella muris]|uniref:hypothetical protein n=1 Tax=Caniella muris TaxID=2941502 RepID=UPI00204217A9|nr:hypothetical protein [Caniella muris]
MTDHMMTPRVLTCTARALCAALAAALWLVACTLAAVAAALAAIWAAALWARLLGATAEWTVTQILLLWGPPTAMSSALCAAALWRGFGSMGRACLRLQRRAADALAERVEGGERHGRR